MYICMVCVSLLSLSGDELVYRVMHYLPPVTNTPVCSVKLQDLPVLSSESSSGNGVLFP